MQKEISIELQKKINNYSYNAFYLCLLLNHDGYYPWFYERYIQLCFNQSKTVKFYDTSELFLDFYNGLAEPHNMLLKEELNKNECQKISINNYIEEMIRKGFVIFTYIDEYYISKYFQEKNKHFTHDILIYGFDNKTKILKVMGFDEQLIFHKYEMNYEIFEKAFNDGLTYSTENNLNEYYLIRMKLKYGNNYKHIFNLSYFLEELNQYIFSINNSKIRPSIYRIYNDEKNVYGYDIYKDVINYLESIDNGKSIDYRIFHTIYEQKSGLFERFNYIKNNFDFPEKESYVRQINSFNHIVKLFENIRLMIIKYNMTRNNIIIQDALKKIRNNYKTENEILIDIYNKLNVISINKIINIDLKIKSLKITLFKNLDKENFFVTNDWKDQDKGSCVIKFNEKLIINHRLYGKNDLKLIFKDLCFDFHKDETYSIFFILKDDPDNLTKKINLLLLSGWDDDKIYLLQNIKIEKFKNVIHINFRADFSGSAFIGLEFFWNDQPLKNCFYSLSDFVIDGKFELHILNDNTITENKSIVIKKKYDFKLKENEWHVINEWMDQEKGSSISIIDDKLILNHRIWGKNELFLINNEKYFQVIKKDKFDLILDLEYFSSELRLIEIYLYAYYSDIKSIPAITTSIKPKHKNNISITTNFSGDVCLGFKFIWKNQPEENEKIIIKNIQIKTIK